jgi:hypothetical protein
MYDPNAPTCCVFFSTNVAISVQVLFEVRVPPMPGQKGPFWKSWKSEFFDDTGSDTATIFEDDLEEIMKLAPEGAEVPTIGEYSMNTVKGDLIHRNVVMQIRVLSPGDNPITRWYPVRVTVYPQSHKADMPVRLSGNWWRHVLYTATAPDNKGLLYASTMKQDLCKALPDVDHNQAGGPKNTLGLGGEGDPATPQDLGLLRGPGAGHQGLECRIIEFKRRAGLGCRPIRHTDRDIPPDASPQWQGYCGTSTSSSSSLRHWAFTTPCKARRICR